VIDEAAKIALHGCIDDNIIVHSAEPAQSVSIQLGKDHSNPQKIA
jgi:hypothetical protein